MQIVAQQNNQWVLGCFRGEELMQSLLIWCKKNKVEGATFTGLGAADEIEIAYYNLATKTFEKHTIKEEVEIVSLIGNVATMKDETILHIHGTFGRRDLSTFGGHIFSVRVSGACEIHLTVLANSLTRSYDEVTGLNLLSCQSV